jgi:beta-lactamase superfamily II metal-dependent hydrolase
MGILSVTLIDVGWGDSIFIEFKGASGDIRYALVDSNDTVYFRSSYIYLKRFFEKKDNRQGSSGPVFEFVLLSHPHADHGQGLKSIMREFGTKQFWYPKSFEWGGLADLLRFSNRSNKVLHHQAVDLTKTFPPLGEVSMKILWPPNEENRLDRTNQNNNSVVLVLTLDSVSFVLSGDAEERVWNEIGTRIPATTRFFKVPHHGSENGTFGPNDSTPWFDRCPSNTELGISSHVIPFGHPDQKVIDLFTQQRRRFFRTDEHYHITCETDGQNVNVKYSHV